MNETLCELLDKGCRELEVELSERQLGQFCRYYEILIERNKVMNLTAITELSDVVTKHFVDSLLVVKAMGGDSKWDIILYRCWYRGGVSWDSLKNCISRP